MIKREITALVYETPPKIDRWFRLLVGGILAVMLVFGLALLAVDVTGTIVILAATALIALLFWAIIPRRYLIYEDRLVVRLGGPFASVTLLKNVKNAKRGKPHDALAYSGIRFATSTSAVIEINRSKGWDLVISPANPDFFLEQLEYVRKSTGNHPAG